MDYLRGAARFYWRTLMSAPAHLYNAWDRTGVIAFALVVIAAAVVGKAVDLPYPAIIAVVVGLFMLALLKTNYDRFLALESDRDALKQKERDRIDKSVEGFRQEWRWKELSKAIDTGRETIWDPLRAEPDGDEGAWIAKIDAWETETREMVHYHWPQYEAFYISDTGLISTVANWHTRLESMMEIKLKRLIEIMTRDIKKRNPGMILDDEKPAAPRS